MVVSGSLFGVMQPVIRLKLITLNSPQKAVFQELHVNGKEGRKEMFYLTTHSTHFILRLYGVGHMVKDHSDSERGNLLSPHGLLFPISSKGYFICIISDRITHTTAFVIYGFMESDIWLRTILIVRKETHCHHIGYSFHWCIH